MRSGPIPKCSHHTESLLKPRAVPGHWEGDLIFGTNSSQIVTLVERQTRYVMMAKADSKDTVTVINALVKHAQQLPRELYASRLERVQNIHIAKYIA